MRKLLGENIDSIEIVNLMSEKKNFNQLLLFNAFTPFFHLILISYSLNIASWPFHLDVSSVSLCFCYLLVLLVGHRYRLCHYLMLHDWKTKLLMRMPFLMIFFSWKIERKQMEVSGFIGRFSTL